MRSVASSGYSADFGSGRHPASHTGPRLPCRRHCEDARSELHGRLPLGPRMRPADVQVQDPRVYVLDRVHERHHCQQGLHRTGLQLFQGCRRPADAKSRYGVG